LAGAIAQQALAGVLALATTLIVALVGAVNWLDRRT
jgi:hypothetical protein